MQVSAHDLFYRPNTLCKLKTSNQQGWVKTTNSNHSTKSGNPQAPHDTMLLQYQLQIISLKLNYVNTCFV